MENIKNINKTLKRILALCFAVMLTFAIVACQSERDYKSDISKHMYEKHKISNITYKSYRVNENGGATATMVYNVRTTFGGFIEANADIKVDSEGNITSCDQCILFG